MKRRILIFRFCFGAALLCGASSISTVFAQPFSSQQLKAAARETMIKARYCALITFDRNGRTNARTMDAFEPDEQMRVWFGTNRLSRKVAEIRRNPHVTLYYFDREDQAYVTLHGTATIVDDTAEKAKHWKEEWKDFYPKRDRDYVLILVRPRDLEVVNTKKGIVGHPRTWEPPLVTFPSR
ncbi:MAG TPA: pyridoxamine 5'-phosphate oxidase family protein [Pyrinomonadaceae bacterium]|nr:pyridoxamine 5'-phosphate oxidase family protein [Pyrinomonadaceae bacterium]